MMKKVFKIALVALLAVTATATYAQKQGRINVQTVVMAMPETKTMQTNLEAFRKDLSDNLETMQVEFNNKYTDYQSTQATMTAAVRDLKQKELQDLQTRMQQFEQNAMQEIQKKQNELLQPIINKAREAISKVSKAGGFSVIFDSAAGAMAYIDETIVVDIEPAVKKELGIQ
ncbi:MAG: OmpH family outer membrane protein [Rikenellaceae bacterium]